MHWTVDWWAVNVAAIVGTLTARGPQLPCPRSSSVAARSFVRIAVPNWRPTDALVLIGGDETGDNRFYDEHLDELRKEGTIP